MLQYLQHERLCFTAYIGYTYKTEGDKRRRSNFTKNCIVNNST